MDFVPHTEAERKEMLAAIGVASFKDLVKDLPLSQAELKIPTGLSEGEVIRLSHELASKNQTAGKLTSYLGAGAYEHFSPAAVSALMSRGEFLTSYTPYQPEVSQGTLQTLYEFQSMICELTAMDVTNAGMYEGASALAEAVLLALRETGRKKVLLPRSLHPDYRTVVSTYTAESEVELVEIPFKNGRLDLEFVTKHLTTDVAAIIVQTPNFFGIVVLIQQKAGGNLSEALGNLSRVLRDRKKMKAKIKAMSMEAKASAGIIGSLPIVVMGVVYVTSPDYIALLWTAPLGRLMLAGSACWMLVGIMSMKKMINFDF